MVTLKATADENTWVDLIVLLSLVNATSYVVQNTSQVTALLTEQVSTPSSNSPYHILQGGQSMGIIVDTALGIWIKGQKGDIELAITEAE